MAGWKKHAKPPWGVDWMEVTAARLDSASKWARTTEGLDEAKRMDVYTKTHREINEDREPIHKVGAAASSQQPAQKQYRTHREASLLHGRLGSLGNIATSFQPARHSVMITGRPVQVPASKLSVSIVSVSHESLNFS